MLEVVPIAKRKMVQYNLVKNAISAYFAAVEIHNKPNIAYRYETVTLLLLNAWELILKAYIKKYLRGKRRILEKSKQTISFDKALSYVGEHINGQNPKIFIAVEKNLLAIEDYRNSVAHYYCEDLQPCIFALVSRGALNFADFLRTYFNKDIITDGNLFILPIGYKLPFNPEEFLAKTSPAYTSSAEAKHFIDSIVNTISSLKDAGVEDSIVLGFSVYLQTIKKPENSELLMKIASKESDGLPVSMVKSVRLSNEPNAQAVKLDDTAFLVIYPNTYKNIVAWCKSNISGFQQGRRFNAIMKNIKENSKFAATRRLNPRNKSSAAQTFYTEAAKVEIQKQFEDME
ncbi:MAG: DUF3644 domain-containing protein [Bacteroidales bacterium]|nr:DUF3644 domain-containing protein [Bacteroidales bacterium]